MYASRDVVRFTNSRPLTEGCSFCTVPSILWVT
jgi:hypothetical protein